MLEELVDILSREKISYGLETVSLTLGSNTQRVIESLLTLNENMRNEVIKQ